VIVGMRTVKQAAKVAELTGGVQLVGKPRKDGTVPASRYVDAGADFEAHRPAVESVSVLFELYDGDAAGYAASGAPGETLPTGWLVTARTARRAGWSARAASTRSWFARRPVKSSTAIETLRSLSVTGRITPVVVQSGPRPHRYPGQPDTRLVQAMARTSDHPAPAELPQVHTQREAGSGEARTKTPQGDA
jgi:hypothetical protein